MKTITYASALNLALREEMKRDKDVFMIGEDIGKYGGAFKVSFGLINEFSENRIIETPISESAIVDAALGAAMVGLKPIAEIMFADFLGVCYDGIANQIAKMNYLLGGKVPLHLVVRSPYGTGACMAYHHSQSVESWFMNISGLKIIIPSNAYDAKGLLKSAIRDCSPVLFLESKNLYKRNKSEIPDTDYLVPLDKAKVKREGKDLSIIAYGVSVHTALEAAEILSDKDISVEVIDLISLKPIDEETILNSVRKTGRVITVHEASKTGGVGGEIAGIVAEKGFSYLKSPIIRLGAFDAPVPFSPSLEKHYIPEVDNIIKAVEKIIDIDRK